MPLKLRPSVKTINKSTGKYVTEHHYIKTMSADDLSTYIEASNSKKKLVQKCRNELTRRGL